MNHCIRVSSAGLILALAATGCGEGKQKASAPAQPNRAKADKDTEIRSNLASLSPEDQKLAEAQKYCPIEADSRLGSMGVPVKVLIKDVPVLVCCSGCQKKALADPERTLARVQELKKLSDETRK